MTILTLSDFKIIGLKENFLSFKGPVYFSMLGTQPGGKPPKSKLVLLKRLKSS